MKPTPTAAPTGWTDLLNLLEQVAEPATIWLFDDDEAKLPLEALLQHAGLNFYRQTHPRWYEWRSGALRLCHIHQSHRSTISDFPPPTHAVWLQAPSLDLRHFWDIFDRRLAGRTISAAATHWQRLQQVMGLMPSGDPAFNLRLGRAALAIGDDRKARQAADQLPSDPDSELGQLGAVCLKAPLAALAGDLALAREVWRTLITNTAVAPSLRAAASAGLGWLHHKQENSVQAQNDWQMAAHLAPHWARPHLELAALLSNVGRPDKALAALRQASAREPGSRRVQSAYGRLHYQLRNYSEAVQALNQAVRQPAHPDEMARDYLYLGRSLVILNQIDEGRVALRQSAAFNPLSSAPHNDLGNVQAQAGNYHEAIAHYEQAILRGDLSLENLAKVHNGVANAYYQVGQHEAAIRNYEQALALNYRYARAYNGLGMVLRATGRFPEAIEAFQKAIQLDNGYAAPYYGLGSIHSVTEDLDEAARAYKASIAREPNSALPHCSLAAIYLRQGREDDARIQLAEAAELIDREKAYNLACYAAIKGEDRVALKWLAKAVEETPGIRSWIRLDPDFKTLHHYADFQALIES